MSLSPYSRSTAISVSSFAFRSSARALMKATSAAAVSLVIAVLDWVGPVPGSVFGVCFVWRGYTSAGAALKAPILGHRKGGRDGHARRHRLLMPEGAREAVMSKNTLNGTRIRA